MKKFILLIVVFGAAGFLAYKLLSDKPVHHSEPKDQALHISKNPPAFNTAFTYFMDQYFKLKDALVQWDTLAADQAAYGLAAKADSLPIRLIKADSNIVLTAQSVAAQVSGEARSFSSEPGIEARRKSFNELTDAIYNLVRTVHYDGEVIYHIRCPMAFHDSEEGFWLSSTSKVVNPYLGTKHPTYGAKMLGCGEVNDSIDNTKN